jgi:hypothetical protein
MAFEVAERRWHSLCKLVDNQLVILDIIPVLQQYRSYKSMNKVKLDLRTSLYGRATAWRT